jgi:hypothetical protein
MTQDEYERTKTRLAEQRRSAIEMVEAGYQAQIQALELYWTLRNGEGEVAHSVEVISGGPAAAPASEQGTPPAAKGETRRSAPEVDADVRATFPLLPETFTVRDVYRSIGYQPYRSALYLSLRKLVQEGLIRVLEPGSGPPGRGLPEDRGRRSAPKRLRRGPDRGRPVRESETFLNVLWTVGIRRAPSPPDRAPSAPNPRLPPPNPLPRQPKG